MTKKRFVKLLMSKGISRNKANFYAWYANAVGRSYTKEIQDNWYKTFRK